LKVARPLTAWTVVVPPRVAPPGMLANARVTGEWSVVTMLPKTSSTRMLTAGVIRWPGTTLLGWAANASWVAGPGRGVAEKGVELPAAEAVRVLLPAVVPSVQEPTVAMPAVLLTALAPVTVPPPEATVKVTVTPALGVSEASRTRTEGGMARLPPT